MFILDLVIFLLTIAVPLFLLGLSIYLLVHVFKTGDHDVLPSPERELSTYIKRDSLMNRSEMVLFNIIVKQLPTGCHVFPKMRIADILKTTNGAGYYRKRNKILPKHVDFVVCNKNFEPVFAIELDGGSHNHPDRIIRDDEVNEIFKVAGLPLERILVGSEFSVKIENIIQRNFSVEVM